MVSGHSNKEARQSSGSCSQVLLPHFVAHATRVSHPSVYPPLGLSHSVKPEPGGALDGLEEIGGGWQLRRFHDYPVALLDTRVGLFRVVPSVMRANELGRPQRT